MTNTELPTSMEVLKSDPFARAMRGLRAVAGVSIAGPLVTKVRLPAFIVTLGTLNIAGALVHIYSNEETIANPPSAMTYLGSTFSIGGTDITYGFVVMLALYALAWFVLTQTAWGSHV